MKETQTIQDLYKGIVEGDRVVLARAITLIESERQSDQQKRSELLRAILPHTGKAMRLGITGVPGVGKSTFIEALGTKITAQNKKVAVLTIDPSSQVSKGSILGDKTRMPSLSKDQRAFIRPTPSGIAVGGVAGRTRESILLCEAAGFDVVIVETVGVGQSEVAVRNMVDFFLLLMLAGAGDELQGIKKGIIEMADALVITKADGDNTIKTTIAQSEYQQALHLLPVNDAWWKPPVLTCSAVTGEGLEAVWNTVRDYESRARASGHLEANRETQQVHWLNESFDQLIRHDLTRLQGLDNTRAMLEAKVRKNEMAVSEAAAQLLAAYHDAIRGQGRKQEQ
ncbi:MAG TPA: methylmalonyl Co-A mutase-associated GTPase MeaB [Cyclobacteriaceae bacterium]|nr:methylmalonyl Co-A mutase-associated GTPase MeaB [Cyclobacteriaceae bacterium]